MITGIKLGIFLALIFILAAEFIRHFLKFNNALEDISDLKERVSEMEKILKK